MTKLIRAFVVVLLAASLCTTTAQNLKSYKAKIAAPLVIDSLRRANVTVKSHESGGAVAVSNDTQAKSGVADGFRIMIFMSKTPTARTEALAARDSIAKYLPLQRQHVTYENPYFKVSVGNCTTQEEALILLEEIKPYFPKAFIMRDNIALEELIIR